MYGSSFLWCNTQLCGKGFLSSNECTPTIILGLAGRMLGCLFLRDGLILDNLFDVKKVASHIFTYFLSFIALLID